MELRIRCLKCDFKISVEPSFVNFLAEGIIEKPCDDCGKNRLVFEISFTGDIWHRLETGAE